jgi:hypothetical protein
MRKELIIFVGIIMLCGLVLAANGSKIMVNVNKNLNANVDAAVRARIQSENYSANGTQLRTEIRNNIRLKVENISIRHDFNISEETEGNKTTLRAKLSNGRNAEIKVMPNRASENALARLRLKICNQSQNCSIELKEVGQREENKTRLAYEVQSERNFRILGLFKARARVMAQVDAETGDIVQVKKPWWAFLAAEPEE